MTGDAPNRLDHNKWPHPLDGSLTAATRAHHASTATEPRETIAWHVSETTTP